MLSQAFTRYINNFRGFSREIWILALITFINRAGTMVIPFLSKYLKEDLHFTYNQVGTIMMCFGAGSLAGSWLGGKLSDKIGFYKIMIFSLFTSGILLICLQYITTFGGLCAGIFGVMFIADMFRPAMFVSVSTYAKPENRTRAMTLVRLAINLGFAAGPAMGGLIIVGIGYSGLFWIDGITCMLAIIIFRSLVKEREKVTAPETFVDETVTVRNFYTDRPFWLFLICSFTTALIFFQLFSTLPLYHKEWYGLTEFHTGLLMSLNGLMVFALEMPIVSYLERMNIPKIKIIFWGALCMAMSFFVLLINVWAGILLFNILFLTFGEMFCFPFSNTFAMGRAPRGQEGRYMAFYTMTFSAAHILSSKTGMEITAQWGYTTNWVFMGCGGLVSAGMLFYLHQLIKKENE